MPLPPAWVVSYGPARAHNTSSRVPLALWHKSLDSLVRSLLQSADDLFGGYHLVAISP